MKFLGKRQFVSCYSQVIHFLNRKNTLKKLSKFCSFCWIYSTVNGIVSNFKCHNFFSNLDTSKRIYEKGYFVMEDFSTHGIKSPADALERLFPWKVLRWKTTFVSCYAKGHGQNIRSIFSYFKHFISVKQTCIILVIIHKLFALHSSVLDKYRLCYWSLSGLFEFQIASSRTYCQTGDCKNAKIYPCAINVRE